MAAKTGDFYEDDEPIEDILAAWERSPKGLTAPPRRGVNVVLQVGAGGCRDAGRRRRPHPRRKPSQPSTRPADGRHGLMASPVTAQLILCDAAQADPNGKIHMLGAGWSLTTSPTAPAAVAALIKVPWDRANQKIDLHLRLLSADGEPVSIEAPLGRQELSTRGQIEVGRPAGLEPGSEIDAAFVLTVPSLPLVPGRYQWRLDIGQDVYTTSFQVRAAL